MRKDSKKDAVWINCALNSRNGKSNKLGDIVIHCAGTMKSLYQRQILESTVRKT